MADEHAAPYNVETAAQSHPVAQWATGGRGIGNPGDSGDGDMSGLGSYCPINLPPNPGPRAADVFTPM